MSRMPFYGTIRRAKRCAGLPVPPVPVRRPPVAAFRFADERRYRHHAKARLGAAFCGNEFVYPRLRPAFPAGTGRILPQCVRPGGGRTDLRVAAGIACGGDDSPVSRACFSRRAGHPRHVPEFRGAGAAAADGFHRDLVCLAADHGCAGGSGPQGARAGLSVVGRRHWVRRRYRDALALSRHLQPVLRRHRRTHGGRDLRHPRRDFQRRHGDPDAAAD